MSPSVMPSIVAYLHLLLNRLLYRVLRVGFLLPLILVMGLVIAACGGGATPTPTPSAQVPPTITSELTPVDTPVSGFNDQLVIWLPAFTGLAAEGGAGAILANAFHQFEQRSPSITLDIQVKADNGTASLFNFLRSAQQVAPATLPDLVLINTQQLWQMADLSMVTALNEDELVDLEFFPVARDAVRYRTGVIGIPYAVDVIHLAYDADKVAQVPITWTEVLSREHRLLFPGAESAPAHATLLQYVGAGGELLEDGTVSDPAVLEQLFTFIDRARDQNIIPPNVLELAGFNSVWRAFAELQGELATVQVNQFYPNSAGIDPPLYAPVPTRTGAPVTIAETWAFAVLTQDAQRRQQALALVDELLAPEVQGPWSQLAARLPSQPQSLALWTEANGYRDFLRQLLGNAVTPPNGPAFADFSRRLQSAQAGLLRGELTVEAALDMVLIVE